MLSVSDVQFHIFFLLLLYASFMFELPRLEGYKRTVSKMNLILLLLLIDGIHVSSYRV